VTNEENDDDVICDLEEAYQQQQQRLQAEQMKYLQLAQEMQKSTLITQNYQKNLNNALPHNSNNNTKQQEYERIINEHNKKIFHN